MKWNINNDDDDDMVNHIISKWNKLVPKKYIKHGWVEVIYQELCKRLKFNHTVKWYMNKPESVLKNEMYKILCFD